MKLNRLLQTAAIVLSLLGMPSTIYSQTYVFSAPISGFSEVDLSFGIGSSGVSRITFGTLNETLYYDPVAKTLRQVGSVTFTPASVEFSMSGQQPMFYTNVSGTAFLTINEGNTNLLFDSGIQTNFYTCSLNIPITGSCMVVQSNQTNSGPLSYSFDVPLLTSILSVTSTNMTISENQTVGFNMGSHVGTVGGVYLYDDTSDGTYYFRWQITNVIAVVPPQLTLTPSEANVILTWPSSVAGWTLQTNNNLATGTWGNYAGPIINNTITNAPSTGNLFFRLMLP